MVAVQSDNRRTRANAHGTLSLLMSLPDAIRTALSDAHLDQLSTAHRRVRVEFTATPAAFAERIVGADAAIVWSSFWPPSGVFARAHRLRWVQSIQVGVDGLMTAELLAASGVVVTASKGPMGPSMAEHIVALMLVLTRKLSGFAADQREGRWRSGAEVSASGGMVELFGKTVALLGVGEVGGRVARICRDGFEMRVIGLTRNKRDCPYVHRYFDRSELHEALAEADVVALSMPVTPDTARIVDEAALAAMKPSAFLINVARGGLVDEAALIEALRSGRIGGAGLDAFAVEPLPQESPLWHLPNVVITPHVSPRTDRVGDHLVDFWCENIRRFAEGEALHGLVDREAGY